MRSATIAGVVNVLQSEFEFAPELPAPEPVPVALPPSEEEAEDLDRLFGDDAAEDPSFARFEAI
jgi:hypothetical protein